MKNNSNDSMFIKNSFFILILLSIFLLIFLLVFVSVSVKFFSESEEKVKKA